MLAACAGMEAVFHCAAPSHTASATVQHSVNVVGTETVVQCCLEAAVKKLVFASAASVVFSGADQSGVDESTPYPAKHAYVWRSCKAFTASVMVCCGASARVIIAGVSRGCVSALSHMRAVAAMRSRRRGRWRSGLC